MKTASLSIGIGLAVTSLTLAMAQPIPLYENFGVITTADIAPQIDALAFANYGTFSVSTLLPYDFQNTLNFTNTGTMTGSPGFQFDTGDSSHPRQMAASFFNRSGASVTAADSALGVSLLNGLPFQTQLVFPSYLLLSATNVANHGLVSVGAGGRLRLEGKQMDLSRGGISVGAIDGIGDFAPVFTNFYVPDIGIFDNYWGGVTNNFMDTSAIVVGGGVLSPPHGVTNAFGSGFAQLFLNNPLAFAFTNRITDTNWLVQVAFVAPAPRLGVQVGFGPSPILTNRYQTVNVELSLADTNVVTGNPDVQTLYFTDFLASDTNYTVLQNFTSNPRTYRPATYRLSRVNFFGGGPPNSPFFPELIYNPSYSNVFATNLYAAYSAQVDFRPIQVPVVQGLSITNQPGRIEIQADELNMARTRVRGNSFVLLSTKHLIGSSDAVVDAPNLSFNLASTNGNLRVQDLARDSVTRLSGFLYAWSGLWTNYLGLIVTNIGPDPMDPTMTVTNLATNVVDIGIHVLMLDASQLTTTEPVLTHDFVSRSANIVLDDRIQVVDSFLLDGQSFTLNGRLQLSSAVNYWRATNAPSLQYFTNNGTLIIDNAAAFGNDRSNAYSAIVNNGTMTGPSYSFRTAYFENSGTINPNARLTIEAQNVKLQRGGSVAGNDVTFLADDVKLLGTRITTGAGFYLAVTNSLQDAGVTVSNVWECQNGFNLLIKPKLGDLFGTTVRSTPPRFAFAAHTWAAEDRGATVEGYQNNAAIGRLVLSGNPGSFLEFDAAGTGGNALYVDYLDLEDLVLDAYNADDLGSFLGTGPGFVLYFADSNVRAEDLDGELGGTVRWVRNFAGPNSSVDVLLLNGQTVKMNRALRKSTTIDTDGDGVANLFDFYPLDAAAWNSVPTASGVSSIVSFTKVGSSDAVSISWSGLPQAAYTVEFATSLTTPNWRPLMNYTNVAAVSGAITVLDADWPARESQRFYRLRNSP